MAKSWSLVQTWTGVAIIVNWGEERRRRRKKEKSFDKREERFEVGSIIASGDTATSYREFFIQANTSGQFFGLVVALASWWLIVLSRGRETKVERSRDENRNERKQQTDNRWWLFKPLQSDTETETESRIWGKPFSIKPLGCLIDHLLGQTSLLLACRVCLAAFLVVLLFAEWMAQRKNSFLVC